MKIKIEFSMKRQQIDLTKIFEEEDQRAVDRLMAATTEEEFEQAIKEFWSRTSFEWCWDPKVDLNAVFVDLSNFIYGMNPSNSYLEVGRLDERWWLSMWTTFEVEIKEGWTPEAVELWLRDNDLFHCGGFLPWPNWGGYGGHVHVLDD
jgi:hypothetical protein